jgi:hypothetical protein
MIIAASVALFIIPSQKMLSERKIYSMNMVKNYFSGSA